MLRQKKGAFELSMTTVVIIVLAMVMLVLGLTLVKTIFGGAIYNVETINEKVRGEINKLFVTGEQKIVVYLANQQATIKQGEDFGVAFGIKNIERGLAGVDNRFTYEVSPSDPDIQTKCGIPGTSTIPWIQTGRIDTVTIPQGDTYYGLARFVLPKGAPLWFVTFIFLYHPFRSFYLVVPKETPPTRHYSIDNNS